MTGSNANRDSMLETAAKAFDTANPDGAVEDTAPDTTVDTTVDTTTPDAPQRADRGGKATPAPKAKGSGSDDLPDAGNDDPDNAEGADKTAATAKPTPPKPVVGKPTLPPQAWSGAAKTLWKNLPPAIQAEVLKREQDFSRRIQQTSELARRYEGLEPILAPVQQQLSVNGMNSTEYVRRLVAADQALQKSPGQALQWLINAYGIDVKTALPHLFAAATASGGAPASTPAAKPGEEGYVDPQILALRDSILGEIDKRIAPLQTGLTTLNGSFQTREQQAQQQQAQQLVQTVTQFQNEVDPATSELRHPYFEEVRQYMASLIENGLARSMEDAYQQAVRANPEVYAQVSAAEKARQTAQQQAQEKARRDAAAKKALDAKRAAQTQPSATGGTAAVAPVRSTRLEDTVRSVANKVMARQ